MFDQFPTKNRDQFLDVAEREMILFEQNEREFRRRVRQEEAEQLRLPIGIADRRS